MTNQNTGSSAASAKSFIPRHIGPTDADVAAMLELSGVRLTRRADRRDGAGGHPPEASARDPRADVGIRGADRTARRSRGATRSPGRTSGSDTHDCITPPVIQRNVLENPGWYTAYTPYQAEVAQGRLEALLNFQTMVMDLTGLEIANASLLDEGTAAAEAMALSYAVHGKPGKETFFISDECHPQTIDVVKTRAHARGVDGRGRRLAEGGDRQRRVRRAAAVSGDRRRRLRLPAVLRARARRGRARDGGDGSHEPRAPDAARANGAPTSRSATRSASACRWDMAVRTPRFSRPRTNSSDSCPGRIIGVSRDADGKPALRMALQTREQHIRREKATSNVCTAQVLLAVIAGMYAVWHGPERLTAIATRDPHARRDARGGPREARLLAVDATTSSTR